MQLNIYKNKMLSVQNAFQQVKSIAREMHMSNAVHQMDDIIQRMTGDDFHLVIVGEFSRGKSTFVNALLGKRILPASKNPTTAIISKIIYGEKPAFRIHYKNGKPPLSMEESAPCRLSAAVQLGSAVPQGKDPRQPDTGYLFVIGQHHPSE